MNNEPMARRLKISILRFNPQERESVPRMVTYEIDEAEGMTLFRSRAAVRHFPTEAREVFDVTGAGDTVVAVCALALASGAALSDAAVLANLAARFVGDEVGTVAVPVEKLRSSIEEAL